MIKYEYPLEVEKVDNEQRKINKFKGKQEQWNKNI